MSNEFRSALEKRKQYLIDQLIASGIYKKGSKHLFEWTLNDLEREYKCVRRKKN
ncbi:MULTISPECIES: Fur-regulated basic protein FbpA [Bacillaceae]|jgi:hypothetical protein|uniref:Fur-regulated basic protein FbpA n=1 Tax=Ectobacillus funiculus TaxID=137993 RepID=A0ABV5WFS1_9BACI|nr:Fur-regulated basic protein FbpA [Ectobacillus funiculus]